METHEQYLARMAARKYVAPNTKLADAIAQQITQVKEHRMFNVIAEDEAQAIEQSIRHRGMTDAFFKNLNNFYSNWSKDNEGPFMVFLNKAEGDIFYGKKTDSLYTSLNTAMKRLKQDSWKLARHGDADNKVLLIKRVS
jgi:hypothetical protein